VQCGQSGVQSIACFSVHLRMHYDVRGRKIGYMELQEYNSTVHASVDISMQRSCVLPWLLLRYPMGSSFVPSQSVSAISAKCKHLKIFLLLLTTPFCLHQYCRL
jgi:hypothetical protein